MLYLYVGKPCPVVTRYMWLRWNRQAVYLHMARHIQTQSSTTTRLYMVINTNRPNHNSVVLEFSVKTMLLMTFGHARFAWMIQKPLTMDTCVNLYLFVIILVFNSSGSSFNSRITHQHFDNISIYWAVKLAARAWFGRRFKNLWLWLLVLILIRVTSLRQLCQYLTNWMTLTMNLSAYMVT